MISKQTPVIDLPASLPGDSLEELAAQMTDVEMRAMLITVYRFCQEIVGFTRQMQKMIDMMNAMGGPSKIFVPNGGPMPNGFPAA